jgi:hypothetical protein
VPPPSDGDGDRGGGSVGDGAQQQLPGNRAGVQRGQCVDAAVERFVFLPDGLIQ